MRAWWITSSCHPPRNNILVVHKSFVMNIQLLNRGEERCGHRMIVTCSYPEICPALIPANKQVGGNFPEFVLANGADSTQIASLFGAPRGTGRGMISSQSVLMCSHHRQDGLIMEISKSCNISISQGQYHDAQDLTSTQNFHHQCSTMSMEFRLYFCT